MKTKKQTTLSKEWDNINFNIIFALMTLVIVIISYKNSFLTVFSLSIISIIGLISWKRISTTIMFLLIAILGPIAEIIAINFGAWSYTSQDIFNIPAWLPLVWGNAGAFIYETSRELKKFKIK